MKIVYNHYRLEDDIPVKEYLKKRKLIKYFNRETSAAIVTAAQLFSALAECNEREELTDLPIFFAKGTVEFEDMGLSSIVEACQRDGKFSQQHFVNTGLSGISPLTQFKVLYNMPLCFVSIENGITTDNSVIYGSAHGLLSQVITATTPYAIVGATKAFDDGSVACGFALVSKQQALSSALLETDSEAIGLFQQWQNHKPSEANTNCVPSSGNSRVVITATGVVSPIGSGTDAFMRNMESGCQGIDSIQNFNVEGFPVTAAAEAKDENGVILTNYGIDRKDLFIRTAVAELMQKVNFSGLEPSDIAMHIGTGIDYFNLVDYISSPDAIVGKWQNYCPHANATVSDIAHDYNIQGGYSTNVAACVASTQALGLSYRLVKQGVKKAAITGGYDSMLCHLHYMGFYKLGALSDWDGDPAEACRPFDKNRRGLVIGEGGVALALQRDIDTDKQNILAEIVGYSSTMDSYMATDPHPEGKYLAQAAIEAIQEAGIDPDNIDCVHLHGTGTHKNAISESKAMQLVFGDRSSQIPVFSLKGQIGHLIGACGAMEMLGVIDSIQNQRVLPTINYSTPDPQVPLNVVTNKQLDLTVNYVLKLNSGFGGQNTAIVVKKYDSDSSGKAI